jgi:hypothetical protein
MTRPDGNRSVTSSIHSIRPPITTSRSDFSSNGLGFEQQTFLGASIRNVSINAGFGDSVTTLSVDLINDEFNESDETDLGLGDDVYHNGQRDRFMPPQVGSPVFFKIGQVRAPVDEAYRSLYNSIYGTNLSQNSIGANHLCFGGILQSYVQNRGPGGNPLYSVQVVDPREILSNVELILNNYAGTTLNNKNMFNLYGFLEYNASEPLRTRLAQLGARIFTKTVNREGAFVFSGDDMYGVTSNFGSNRLIDPPSAFPITGTGFSRRCPQGIPFFRVAQSLNALLGLYGRLPPEYVQAGFGGFINFRGFNYVVDLSGLPSLPDYYFLDFDQINLLDLCLEICDVTNRELFVSLLPIIPNHPASSNIYAWNQANRTNFIAGIIRVDSIDRSFQPQYGAIKNYIDRLTSMNIPVENQDIGFELSNIVTDKFVVGAQQVDTYFFSGFNDRKVNNQSDQWRLGASLNQQILPYYGLLGNNAVTIPKGFGSYQQILLDSSSLTANGVGRYYVATEMELRAALVSYERWSDFLLMYNDIYMEKARDQYVVSVPRSVFDSEINRFGQDGLPLSACNPPYGYPLYYKRATRIGIQGAGLSNIYARFNRVTTNLASLAGASSISELNKIIGDIWDDLASQSPGELTAAERQLLQELRSLINNPRAVAGLIQRFEGGLARNIKAMNRLAKQTKENSQKVYNFLRQIADECLGKKFLVKIPQFSDTIFANTRSNNGIGPFGFGPNVNPLKINFNPIIDEYEFNYMPEKQGGYINFDLFDNAFNKNNLAISQGLVPQDLTNFISQNGRLSPYVCFYHSQFVSFNNVPADSFSQQSLLARYFVPNLDYSLDNVGENGESFFQFFNANDIDNGRDKPRTIAFVKCDLDDKFYMPPKVIAPSSPPTVYATRVKNIKQYVPPVKRYNADTESWEVVSAARTIPYYVPDEDAGLATTAAPTTTPAPNGEAPPRPTRGTNAFFLRSEDGRIVTNLQNLDTRYVYALITLPGRLAPTMDSRFRDGPFQNVNADTIKHLMTMDVVKLPEFLRPNPIPDPGKPVRLPENANEAYRVALEKSVNFALPNLLNFISPSPVYPDLVALPLLSKERCYGPWVSQPNAAGGKVEFIKDENLAPWNFSGYQLMNEAGLFKASFTGSLLTQSERGGFVTPIVPAGISIGRFLSNLGPLVTNISIDISDQGVKSTVKMDLYTVSFGKLRKQKEYAIANVSRERQKLKDERNALIRQGIAKNQTNINFNLIYDNIKKQSISSRQEYNPRLPSSSSFTMSINSPRQTSNFGSDGEPDYPEDYYTSASVQSYEELGDIMTNIAPTLATVRSYYNTVNSDLSDQYSPISSELHPDMPSLQDNNLLSAQDFYNLPE